MNDVTPLPRPAVGRRTVLRGAAWTAPAISLAATAPAYAMSNLSCTVVGLTPNTTFTAWTGFTRHTDTGWYYRPSGSGAGWAGPSRPGYVNSEQYTYYDEYVARGTHAFLSFQDNKTYSGSAKPTGRDTLVLEYTFALPAGEATVNMAGGIIFGYGHKGTQNNVACTDRQMVKVEIVDGATTQLVAAMAPRRKSATGNGYYPDATMHTSNQYSAATAASYALLQQTDEQVAQDGYTLHDPYDAGNTRYSQGRFLVPFARNDITLTGTNARAARVRYTLTLPDVRTNWVNDDVILREPTVSVCVPQS